jgi:hypothetical protein
MPWIFFEKYPLTGLARLENSLFIKSSDIAAIGLEIAARES